MNYLKFGWVSNLYNFDYNNGWNSLGLIVYLWIFFRNIILVEIVIWNFKK